MQKNNKEITEIWLFNLQHTSVLKAQPRQHISNIYIFFLCQLPVYIGSEVKSCMPNYQEVLIVGIKTKSAKQFFRQLSDTF